MGPLRVGYTGEPPLLRTLAWAFSVALAVMMMAAGCTRPVSTAAAQPVSDLSRQSEMIQRELGARGEQELAVRVTNATRRILQGGQSVDAENAADIETEVDAINTLLSSLNISPLAPALRFDPGQGRLVW